MIGGCIDMLSTGAVISNFPARGQGKAFLINDIEFATAQFWVNPEMGIQDFEDLKGKQHLHHRAAPPRMCSSTAPCAPTASTPTRT